MKWLIGTKIQAKIDQEMICSGPNPNLLSSWNPNQGTYLVHRCTPLKRINIYHDMYIYLYKPYLLLFTAGIPT